MPPIEGIVNPRSLKMDLVTCPGCGETFTPEERMVEWEGREAKMEHFTDPLNRLFCCDDCFIVNG